MSPYALNTRKGTTVNHPEIGELIGGIARPVSENDANQLKHTKDIVIFDTVMQYEEKKEIKEPGKEQVNIQEDKNDKPNSE